MGTAKNSCTGHLPHPVCWYSGPALSEELDFDLCHVGCATGQSLGLLPVSLLDSAFSSRLRLRQQFSCRYLYIVLRAWATFIGTLLAFIAGLFGILLGIPVILVGSPFWAVAFLTRACSRLLEPRSKPWEQLIEFDPTVGWKLKPNLKTHCSFVTGVFSLKTDLQGWRGTASIAESKVVVFGDSYAFGYGIDEKALFSEIKPRLRIKAVGAPGYNMVQGLLWMSQLAPQLRGKLVVWFICLGNDLYDNLQPNMQSYRVAFVREVNGEEGWEIVTRHITPSMWPYNVDRDQERVRNGRYTAAFGTTSLSRRVYSACDFLIEKGRDACAEAGARLVIMTIPLMSQFKRSVWDRSLSRFGDPTSFDPDLPDQKLAEICRKLGVPFVAGKDYLDVGDYISEDGHWNRRGHRRIAQLLWSLCYNKCVARRKRTWTNDLSFGKREESYPG